MAKRGRPKKEPGTQTLTIRIETADLALVEDLARRDQRTTAFVVRQAVKDYLRAHPLEADDFSDLIAAKESMSPVPAVTELDPAAWREAIQGLSVDPDSPAGIALASTLSKAFKLGAEYQGRKG